MDLKNITENDRRFFEHEIPSEALCSLLRVDTEWQNLLRIVDSQGSLRLVHYLQLSDPSENEKVMKHIGHVRGTIVDIETNEIVCRSFPHTPEYVIDTIEDLKAVEGCLSGELYYAREGTIIRLFFHLDKWHASTHHKIDANDSKWSGPSFGSLFGELCNLTLSSLSKEYCYIFLLCHQENKFVFSVDQNELLFLAAYNRNTSSFEYTCGQNEELLSLNKPELVSKTLQQILETIKRECSASRAGLIVIPNKERPFPIKLISKHYKTLRDICGGNPDLRIRYLQLFNTLEGQILRDYNPEKDSLFEKVNLEVDELVLRLHKLYVNRYVRKNFEQLPKEEFVTLKRCHEWHMQNRGRNIVTPEKIKEMVVETPYYYLLPMLERNSRSS